MDSMTDFAVCGFCGKTVYIERITAPEKWKPAELREIIRRRGEGLGVCPDCGKPSRFMTRGRKAQLDRERELEAEAVEQAKKEQEAKP